MAISIGGFWHGNNIRVQDENNFRADTGATNVDRTHDFRINSVYGLPIDRLLKLSGPVKGIVGGWQLSGILRASTGAPITISQSNSRELQRPDYAGGDPYLHPSTIDGLYLSKAAFATVPLGKTGGQTIRPGNVGKASLRAPGYWTLDMNLAKRFRFTERFALQMRLDMFNAFNHVNWGTPGTDINNSLFGRITSAGAARSMQVALRLTF